MSDLLPLLRGEQRNYADLQKALLQKIAAKGRPPDAAEHQILDEWRQRESAYRAHADFLEGKNDAPGEPVYRHDMVAGTLDRRGFDPATKGYVPGGTVAAPTVPHGVLDGAWSLPLSPEQKVLDAVGGGHITEDAIYGALGCLVKGQTLVVDPAESEPYARALGLQTKDMLTSGSAGVLVPTTIAASIIDLMRARTVVTQLGARTVPMKTKQVTVPRITGDVTAQWLTESATLALSDATLDGVPLTAERLDAGTKVSMELEEDSDPVAIGRIVAQSIAAAFALKIDAAALRGSGVSPEPRGIRNTTGVTLYAPGTNGDPMDYGLLLQLAKAVMAANAEVTGYVMTPGAAITLAGLRETATGPYIAPPAILQGVLANASLTTTTIPANLTKGTGTALTEVYAGDWGQLLLGLRVGLSIQTARELYRPEGKVGIFGRMRVGVAVEHGPAFAVATHVDD